MIDPTCPVVEACASNGVHLIEEDDAGLLGARHLEQVAHHACPLAHILLHELRTDDADEAGICAVGHCAGQQRLACSA